MVFIPSTENVNVMLPSNVISGCKYIRKEEIKLIYLKSRNEFGSLACWHGLESQFQLGNLRHRKGPVTWKTIFWRGPRDPDNYVLWKLQVKYYNFQRS